MIVGKRHGVSTNTDAVTAWIHRVCWHSSSCGLLQMARAIARVTAQHTADANSTFHAAMQNPALGATGPKYKNEGQT